MDGEGAVEALGVGDENGEEGVRGRVASRGRRARSLRDRVLNQADHVIERLQDFVVCYTEYFQTLRAHPLIAAAIVFGGVGGAMGDSVNLDDESDRGAEEVCDVRAEGMLPAEACAEDLIALQARPEQLLGEGHGLSEFAGARYCERAVLLVIVRMQREEGVVGRVGCPSPPAWAGPPPKGRGS